MESHNDNRLRWLPSMLPLFLFLVFLVSTLDAQESANEEMKGLKERLPSDPSYLEVPEKEVGRFFHVTSFDLHYNYSDQKGGDSTEGAGGWLLFSPGIRLNEKITFLAIYIASIC